VVGAKLAKARTRIARAHCRVGTITRKHAAKRLRGKVIAQSPRAGRRLANGARIRLTVGR
jgi:beta-lactam-binding protein with PASTA domain